MKERRGSAALVLVSIYGLFIYVPLSGFLPPTSAEDSHRMREMYLTGRSVLALCFHVMQRAILGKQADICFPPFSFLSESVDIFVHPTLEHTELLARITHNLTKCVLPALQCCNTSPKIASVSFSFSQYAFIHV